MSCCPPESWPALKAESEYQPKGETIKVGKAPNEHALYVIGKEHAKEGKAIVIVPDIFGIDTGRHKAIADTLAEHGFVVVLADFCLGNPLSANDDIGKTIGAWAKDKHDWAQHLKSVFTDAAIPHLKSLGIDKFATMG